MAARISALRATRIALTQIHSEQMSKARERVGSLLAVTCLGKDRVGEILDYEPHRGRLDFDAANVVERGNFGDATQRITLHTRESCVGPISACERLNEVAPNGNDEHACVLAAFCDAAHGLGLGWIARVGSQERRFDFGDALGVCFHGKKWSVQREGRNAEIGCLYGERVEPSVAISGGERTIRHRRGRGDVRIRCQRGQPRAPRGPDVRRRLAPNRPERGSFSIVTKISRHYGPNVTSERRIEKGQPAPRPLTTPAPPSMVSPQET